MQPLHMVMNAGWPAVGKQWPEARFFIIFFPPPHGIMFFPFNYGRALTPPTRLPVLAYPTPGYHIWEAHSEDR